MLPDKISKQYGQSLFFVPPPTLPHLHNLIWTLLTQCLPKIFTYCLKHFFYNNGERPLFLDVELAGVKKYETQNFRYKFGGSLKEL